MSAKGELTSLANYLNHKFPGTIPVDASNAVGRAIALIDVMAEISEAEASNVNTTVPMPRERMVLVAANKAKSGQQPWSEWATDINSTVDTLLERVKTAERLTPGFQYEVMEVEVLQRALIEMEVRAVNVT